MFSMLVKQDFLVQKLWWLWINFLFMFFLFIIGFTILTGWKSDSEVHRSQILPLTPFCSCVLYCTSPQRLSVMSSDVSHLGCYWCSFNVDLYSALRWMLLNAPGFLTSDISIWFDTVSLYQTDIAPLTFPATRNRPSARICQTSSARTSNVKQSLGLSESLSHLCCQTVHLNLFLASSFDVFSNFLLFKTLQGTPQIPFKLILINFPCCTGFHILLNWAEFQFLKCLNFL